MDTNPTTTPEPCFACQVSQRMRNGEDVPEADRNRWAMWGCTCDPQDEADAMDWFDRVTR